MTTPKAPIVGLMPRRETNVHGRQAVLGGVTHELNWKNIQTTQGGPINTAHSSWTSMDTTRAYGLPMRVRVFGGIDAPDWAKNLAGGALSLCEPTDGSAINTVGRWWTPEYLEAWDDLMRKLAVLLEPDEQIREFASYPATTVYGEPFQRGYSNKTRHTTGPNNGKYNAEVVWEAGATGCTVDGSGNVTGPDPKDYDSVMYPVKIDSNGRSHWQNLGWERTRFYLPFNPFQQPKVLTTSPYDYSSQVDPAGCTASAITTAAANMPGRVIVGNNSWRTGSVLGGTYGTMYSNLANTVRVESIQTAQLVLILSAHQELDPAATEATALKAVLDTAFGIVTPAQQPTWFPSGTTAMRALSVELPNGWNTVLTDAECTAYNERAASNLRDRAVAPIKVGKKLI